MDYPNQIQKYHCLFWIRNICFHYSFNDKFVKRMKYILNKFILVIENVSFERTAQNELPIQLVNNNYIKPYIGLSF